MLSPESMQALLVRLSLATAHPTAASLVTLNSAVLSSSFSDTSCAECGEGRMRKYVSMVWCRAGSACCALLRMAGGRRRPADGHDHHLIYHCVQRVTRAAERATAVLRARDRKRRHERAKRRAAAAPSLDFYLRFEQRLLGLLRHRSGLEL